MQRKYAILVILLVVVAGCSQRVSPTEPLSGAQPALTQAAAVTGPGDEAAGHASVPVWTSATRCPAHGQPRPTTYTRYWPFPHRTGEVAAASDTVVLDWVDYDASGVPEWYSYRYRPLRRLWDAEGWSPWIDVDDSHAVITGLEPNSPYKVEVRAVVDDVVPGGRHHCFFTGPGYRTVRTASLSAGQGSPRFHRDLPVR